MQNNTFAVSIIIIVIASHKRREKGRNATKEKFGIVHHVWIITDYMRVCVYANEFTELSSTLFDMDAYKKSISKLRKQANHTKS